MTETKAPPTKAEVMPLLANGINNALLGTFGSQLEFLLIVALPSDEEDYVELSTITGITDPDRLLVVSQHIQDLAQKAAKEQGLVDDTDVQGHA